MNAYKNKKTGVVMFFHGNVTGHNWEPVEEVKEANVSEPETTEKPKKKSTKK